MFLKVFLKEGVILAVEMPETRRGKKRSHLRKLYTFTCGRSSLQAEEDSLHVGGPGFSRIVYCNDPEKRVQ